MKKYKILRAQPMLIGNKINPNPIIYFQPDDDIKKSIKENGNDMYVSLFFENLKTNCPKIKANVQNAGFLTPNYYNKTGPFIAILDTNWKDYGYYENNFSYIIFHFDDINESKEKPKKDNENFNRETESKLKQTLMTGDILKEKYKGTKHDKIKNILILFLILFLIFLVGLICYVNK